MRCLSALLPLIQIRAELGYSIIKESLEWRSYDGARVRHSGPLNPLRGFLLSSIGAFHNMRFFSPGICPCYTLPFADGRPSYRRHYNRDTALHNNAFHRTLLALFPSSSGRVSIASTRSGSFCYELSKSKERRQAAVRLLAALAAMSLGSDIKWTSKTTGKRQSVTVHVTPPIVMQGSSLDEVAEVVEFFGSGKDGDGYLRSRMFLLQGFVYYFLDTRDELETFFGQVYKQARRSGAFAEPGETESVDYTLLEEAIRMNSVFPFSPVNPLPTNTSVPFYSREKGIIDSKHFSDCGEAALLGLVCSLLYNSSTMTYTTEHLRKSPLRKFFERHRSIFPVTMDTRVEWLSVVEDIPDSGIVYVKTYNHQGQVPVRNEIKSGLINMLAVLRKIARTRLNLDFEDLLGMKEKPFDYSVIKNVFEDEFRSIIAQIYGRKNEARETTCDFGRLRVEDIPNTGTWDVFGSVTITIPAGVYGDAVLELTHSLGHAKVTILQYPFVQEEESIDIILKSANALIGGDFSIQSLIGRYVRCSILQDLIGNVLFDDVSRALKEGLLHNVFISGAFDTDNKKGRLLDALFPYSMDYRMYAMQITHNVVSSGALDDKASSFTYAPFILMDGSLIKFENALDAWWMQNPVYKALEWAIREHYINVVCYFIYLKGYVLETPSRYDLLHLLAQHGRVDCISELLRLYGRPMDTMVQIFEIGVSRSFENIADHLFDEIQKEDLERYKHSVEDVEEYLEKRALHPDASQEDLEKIYYWFFCANYLGLREQRALLRIVLSTCMRVGTDFLYDCIVRRCPSFHKILYFYKGLLEFAISNQVRVRNDAFVLMRTLAHTHLDDPSNLRKEIAALVGDVESAGLVDNKIDFSTEKYEKFIEKYARDGPYTNLEYYTLNTNSIFGRSEALTTSFLYFV